MRVYLDNNIFISIEDGELRLNELLPKKPIRASFFYSYTHIQEFLERKTIEEKNLSKRMETISTVTENNYIFPNRGKLGIKKESPLIVFNLLRNINFISEELRQRAVKQVIDRDKLIRLLNIESKKINNYSPTQVIDLLNNKLVSKALVNLNGIIFQTGDSLHERIISLFNFLDHVGFWKDEEGSKSRLPRIFDASHAYFASGAEFFVSDDKRARNKAKVAFSFFEIDTKVFSCEEFIRHCNNKI